MRKVSPEKSRAKPAAELTNVPSGIAHYVTLAKRLGVSVITLIRWVKAGKIIQPTYFGIRAIWDAEKVAQILKEGTQPAGTYPCTFSIRSHVMKRVAASKPRSSIDGKSIDPVNVKRQKSRQRPKLRPKQQPRPATRKRGAR